MRKRLHESGERPFGPLGWPGAAMVLLLGVILSTGCDTSENPLADYAGQRPLTFLRVTQSYTPDIQWVGGRVAAIGINKGTEPALDATLVWLRTASGNDITSHVTVGEETDAAGVANFGGTAVDSLDNGGTYTFWIAERSAFDAGLNPNAFDGFNFADTTLSMALVLAGRQRGRMPVTMTLTRDERLLGERFILDWQPRTTPVRRIAIRKGSGSAGFIDLVWHVLLEDDAPDSIVPPLEIGQLPPGAVQAVAWPDGGFVSDTYTLWMVDSSWTGAFGLNPSGMAYLVLFASNF